MLEMHYPAFIKFLLWMLFDFAIRTCRASQLPEFRVSHLNKCWPNDSYFTKIFGISLQQCVQECDNRRKCKSINFRRNVQLCELIPTTADFDDNASDTDGTCTIVHRKDTQTQNNCSCAEHEVCDPKMGTCSVKECVPFSITNGTFLGNMNGIDSRVKFTCNIGTREKNGESISICQENGNWSVNPQCIIVCDEPTVIDNSFFPHGEYIPGETRHYECADNYDTTDDIINMTTTCLDDGSWSPINFTCIWDCGNPPYYPHSSIHTDMYPDIYPNIYTDYNLAGTTGHYRCDDNYSTGNDDVIMETACEAGRNWTETHFTCYRDCGNVIIQNGIAIVNDGTTITNTATINCNCGYTLYGENTLTCTEAGWDKDFPTCKAWTPHCPEGFQLYCDSCYLFDTDSYSWDEAWTKCQDTNDGHLVNIDNQAENDWLADVCGTNYTNTHLFWINLSDRTVEGKWIWNDTNSQAIYTNWADTEQTGGDTENCASIYSVQNYKWADIECKNIASVICERVPHNA